MHFIASFLFKLLLLFAIAFKCNGQGMVALSNIDNIDETNDAVPRNVLKSVFEVAKNISYSKGPIIKSKEGEYQYRRSFTSKVEFEVNSLQLKNVIAAIKENVSRDQIDKSVLLDDLYYLENLVSQYDIGKKFVELNGFTLILSLTMNEDDDISKAAFIVLSSAMQSNLDVQKFASTTDLLKFIILTLHQAIPNRINSALFTLSAFIRNNPDSLFVFLTNRGIYLLSLLLDNPFNITKAKLRVMDIFSDISTELMNDEQNPVLKQMQRKFQEDLQLYLICEKIVNMFSVSEGYSVHEKFLIAITSLYDTCKNEFEKEELTENIKLLLETYNPFKSAQMWYIPMIDVELRYYMYEGLKQLQMKITSKSTSSSDVKSVKYEL